MSAGAVTGASTGLAAHRLVAVAVMAALAAFLGVEVLAALAAHRFEYPLDDVYIHLAMAEGLARGHLGVNPGEAVAASSSILYPVLLMPFAGTEAQRLLPLLWNAAGLVAGAALWGLCLAEAWRARALPGRWALGLALAGPVALNLQGVAFTGMENGLHLAASLAVVLGLWRFLTGRGVAAWFVAALILSPLLRYEGLALSLGAAAIIGLSGRARLGLGLAGAILLPVVAWSLLLVHLGLPALPGSVVAKTQLQGVGLSAPAAAALRVIANLLKLPGLVVALLSLAALGLAGRQAGPARSLLALAGLAGLAHVVAAQFGWMDRYEIYILAVLCAALVIGGGSEGLGRWAVIAALVVLGPWYQARLWGAYVWNPAEIGRQQAQMARFVRDFAREPVAVNDMGLMSWRNNEYVFDLWGLGSPEALAARRAGTAPGWAAPLLARHGIRLAIIYEKWFGTALGPGWQPVADLTVLHPRGRLGDWRVTFYAQGADEARRVRTELTEFAPGLPEGVALSPRGQP
ncbi:MAG: hypothetical protein JSR87_14620 [Proteobacteria bacterium]|nr:hypothetical protein [Pseudomonadota bacterium]MBS0573197.1 hypothetical protein [Pseudomonadota bacterium]